MPPHNSPYQKVVARNNSSSFAPAIHADDEASGRLLGDQDRSNTSHKMMDTNETQPGVASIPPTVSSEELMPNTSRRRSSSTDTDTEKGADLPVVARTRPINRKELFTVMVLCFVNLINYMDRLTIAGVLPDIQKDFNRDNSDSGLLQTVFVISYMVCAPVFGYLGDRHSRRWIMILGVAVWSATTLIGSFMSSWGWFMVFRALVGIGEASYSTIAPTIISDLFTHNMRSKMLACFYFAIPVGSGLGYIIGSETAQAFNDWRYALRVTPLLGLLAVFLIYFCKEPERGENEGSGHMEATSYREDLKDLCKNRSFMYSTLGFTCVAFVTGGLSWWGPTFMHLGVQLQPGSENIELNSIAMRFGLITMFAGLCGVPLGSYIAQLKRDQIPNVDPIICATGILISAPSIFIVFVTAAHSSAWSFFFVFVAMLSLNMCWSLVADMLLYVVVPTRRSTAEAFQILISHMFGDAGSPYLVGLVSEAFKRGGGVQELPGPKLTQDYSNAGLEVYSQLRENATSAIESTTNAITSMMTSTTHAPRLSITDIENEFTSLQYALFIMCFIEVVGAALFFVTSFYVVRDKKKVDNAIRESHQPHRTDMDDSLESSSLSI